MKSYPFAVRFALRLAPVVPTALALSAAATMVACADEKDPATWVKRLDDPAQRAAAIKRLGQFYEDARTAGKGNDDDPAPKAMRDIIVAPLTATYEKGGLDDKTRKDLAKVIADLRDERTAPFMTKVFKEWEPNKSDEDVKYAAQAATVLFKEGKLKDPLVIDALWDCFAKFRVSQTKLSEAFKALNAAVLAAKSTTYGPKALAKLEVAYDPAAKADYQFWQQTSVQVLSELKVGAAAKQLVKTILDTTKPDLAGSALKALSGIPQDAEKALIAAMSGDPEYAPFMAKWPATGPLPQLSGALAAIGTAASRDAIVAALPKAPNDEARATMALSLTNFPADPKAQAAYIDAYQKIDAHTLIGASSAKGKLMSGIANFYDVKLATWAIKEGATLKGIKDEGTISSIQGAAVQSANKLFDVIQRKDVGEGIKKIGLPDDLKLFESGGKAVDACRVDAECYVKVLDEPVVGTPAEKFRFVKASYMAGAFGNEGTRQALVSRLSKVKDDTVRMTMLAAIDHLAPKGDVEAAKTMEKLVEANAKSPAMSDGVMVQVAAKLRARAQ